MEDYPILRFDPDPQAVIEPSRLIQKQNVPEHAVICFFGEVIEKVKKEFKAQVVHRSHSEMGEHLVYEISYQGKRLAFYHPGIGAPLVVGLTEEVIALGVKKFVACGGCGVLDKNITVGKILIPIEAVRDEGTSYHYLEPGYSIKMDAEVVCELEKILKDNHVSFARVKTWTTDAFYRETQSKVSRFRLEGCLTVEMEAASLLALANFRNVKFGQFLYGGDSVAVDGWDFRSWNNRFEIRESLFWLSADACLNL